MDVVIYSNTLCFLLFVVASKTSTCFIMIQERHIEKTRASIDKF